ncbi:MAG: Uma2 family endonuclease [Cytophagales bacterium]
METRVIEISDYELERGKPMPSKIHSKIQILLGCLFLNKYASRFDFLSELDVFLNGNKYVPDIAIYRKGILDFEEDESMVYIAPLAVIEILSPSQALGDLIIKMKKYIEGGVKSYWLVVPQTKTVFLFDSNKEQTTFISGTIKDHETGIELQFDEIFKS